ncbi:MFS transporter [Mucilaginibacter hurinus]|uniref:MFS transporter n=1 Tax=Mucilaginibacter hurinus TaxID=2201324 RepID=A0A367GTA6_9SPHI|nr:MFS transporter [Mucilaginibacter hurinus]RCH55943.1 MFS transporter [Mucilaginibacter hurinus]
MTEVSEAKSSRKAIILVLVAALGYFVDLYDLIIFAIVRTDSLKAIGVAAENIREEGVFIMDMQMGGLLLGGILWGIIGDKFGRIKVLFGSIILYSLANIANAFVQDVTTYGVVRFIAGIGLAGELGAGVTLVTETLSKKNRGWGTTIVATIGLFGAVVAALVGQENWRHAYLTGGGLGIVLLLLRIGTFESGMFKNIAGKNVSKGNMLMLFNDWGRFKKYICCILIGSPLWFVVGILVTQAPEFGKELGATEVLVAGTGVMFTYIGISIGDIFAGLLSQLTRSRKLAMLIFQLLSVVTVVIYLTSKGITPDKFKWVCLAMGFCVGYWATFITIAAEQFGTNIRSTVATTVPNFIRGALIPINFAFDAFVSNYGMVTSGLIMMFILTGIALFALSQLKESFSKDLDYVEEDAEAGVLA